MTKIARFPTPEPEPPPPLCTCPERHAALRRSDGSEIPVEDWIAVPEAERDLWLLACDACTGTTAQQRRAALNLALAAAEKAEKAVADARAARTRALAAIERANLITANARLLGSADGLPPRLTTPLDILTKR